MDRPGRGGPITGIFWGLLLEIACIGIIGSVVFVACSGQVG